ncbi:MAG: DUF309 domain-containing protein [Chthoniobacterales bacterium]
MKKSQRLKLFVETLEVDADSRHDPRYLGYFDCFNRQLYYEAHDVLEDLWLQQKDANHAFYKALIQVAGVFVHLQKQYYRPHHHKDGRRLYPAVRLLEIAVTNLSTYGDSHLGLDVEGLSKLCRKLARKIEQAGFQVNPWRPERAPVLKLHKH